MRVSSTHEENDLTRAGIVALYEPFGIAGIVLGTRLDVTEDPLELHMWVYGKSQKAVNVRRNPRASVLVESGEPYQDLRGVLVRGDARIVSEFEQVLGQVYT